MVPTFGYFLFYFGKLHPVCPVFIFDFFVWLGSAVFPYCFPYPCVFIVFVSPRPLSSRPTSIAVSIGFPRASHAL